jgi:hypothetical protein
MITQPADTPSLAPINRVMFNPPWGGHWAIDWCRRRTGEWHSFHALAQVRAGCSFRENPNRYEGIHANAL